MKMTDTEGEEIPLDDNGSALFDISLWGDGVMLMNAPWFYTDNGVYDSVGGVLQVDLKEILMEYLSDAADLDGGEGFTPLATMLREIAELYDAQALKNQEGKCQKF